ncbi:MAG TPA: MFS transporter [Pseudonocardia sp.]|nr:MFS transporter [Pseudonocardia sp.]
MAPGAGSAPLRRARTAVVVAFAVNGSAFAALLSRGPALRDGLGLSAAGFGLLLLCLSAGAVAGLPAAGPLVHRLGAARVVAGGALLVAAGFAAVATGLATGAVPVAAAGLAAAGLGMGTWDVAMNVEGAEVERRLGRSLMPRLHAAFSLGTVAGAGIGVGTAAAGLPLAVQVGAIAALSPLVTVPATRAFTPATAPQAGAVGGSGTLVAWREPRTLALGLLVLGFAFTEGTANDWLAVALVDGYGLGEAGGAAGFGLFVAAMTAARLAGVRVLDRFGRVAVLRAAAGLALAGVVLVTQGVLAGGPAVAMAGAVLWGLGTALGFPVGMSAAADDPARAAARVSVVSAIGYTAFLAGPPLIGLLAERAGILRSLLVVVGALALAVLAIPAARPAVTGRRRTPGAPGRSPSSAAG